MYELMFMALFGQCSSGGGGCGQSFGQPSYVQSGCGSCGSSSSSGQRSGCNSGSCGTSSSGCNISSGGLPIVYDNTPLHMQLHNIAGGVERTRTYAKVQFNQKTYTIPVINGHLPAIDCPQANLLILNYAERIPYTAEQQQRAVINYGVPNTVPSTNAKAKVDVPAAPELKAPGLALPPGPEPFDEAIQPTPLKFPEAEREFDPKLETRIPQTMQRPSLMLPPKHEIVPTYK